jgi:hypothetical protein
MRAPDLGLPARAVDADLAARRFVAAGERAYIVGTADGRFPPLGWHIKGQMGGVWAHPIKLLDSLNFSVDGAPLAAATRFTHAPGAVQFVHPPHAGLDIVQTRFVPAPLAAALFGLTLHNPSAAARIALVTVEAVSRLLPAYPWDWCDADEARPVGPDRARLMPGIATLIFTRPDRPWTTFVRGSLAASGGEYPPDDGPVDGASLARGRLTYEVELAAGASSTLWIVVAGSHLGFEPASRTAEAALRAPDGLLRARLAGRRALLETAALDVPDAGLRDAWDWAKLNLADCRIILRAPEIRDVDAGRAYPPPRATPHRLRGFVGGYPDYVSLFGVDGAYTALAAAVCGQWEPAMDHLRALRDVSRWVNGATGKVVHEIAPDGSVYYGNNAHPGNAVETALFALAVEGLWRWSGDAGFRAEMLDFVRDGLRGLLDDAALGVYPRGRGIVERGDGAAVTVDTVAATWRALLALDALATDGGDLATAAWARERAAAIAARFADDWWLPREGLFADSAERPGDPDSPGLRQDYHWVNAVPMQLGLAGTARAIPALERLESAQFTGPGGLAHTGLGRERAVWALVNGVMAVAEARYGRISAALRYMRPISEALDAEMPGALPELVAGANGEIARGQSPMLLQAWSGYGLLAPVVEYLFGVAPDAPHRRLTIIPQLPAGWPGAALRRLRVGAAEISIQAAYNSAFFALTVTAMPGWTLTLGLVVPPRRVFSAATLDGAPAALTSETTRRGSVLSVTFSSTATPLGTHELIVTA